MKILDLEQGTEEWLEWRANGITATDVSILDGSNTYTTPYELWEQKCGYGKAITLTAPMKHGIDNEPLAREWINRYLNLNLKPICVEDDDNPVFKASLDGYDSNRGVLVEIKCPVSERTLELARLSQAIPDYWFSQVQWQIMITKPQEAYIAVWDHRYQSCILIPQIGIERQINKLKTLASQFWSTLQTGNPPERKDKDCIEIEDPSLLPLLNEYKTLHKQEKIIKDRKKELKEKIVNYGDDGSFTAYGYKIMRYPPNKTYDYEQMRLDGIDIEKYQKNRDSIGYYRIS